MAPGWIGLASSISYVLRSFSLVIDPAANVGAISDASTYCPRKNNSTSRRDACGLVMSIFSSCGQAK